MKTVSFKVVGNWLIAAYGTMVPAENDWAVCLQTFKSMDIDRTKILIYTQGGAPTAAQRKVMNDVLNGREPVAAVVSSSVVARGIATAMSWFNHKLKVFSPDAIDHALRYLEIPQAQHELFHRELALLLAELEPPKAQKTASMK